MYNTCHHITLLHPSAKSDCSPYDVSSNERIQYITLTEGVPLTFYLQPSHSVLMVRVIVGFAVYRVSVCMCFEIRTSDTGRLVTP